MRAGRGGAGVILLSVGGLTKHYRSNPGPVGRLFGRRPAVVRAVDGVGFDIARGETLGLIGESGCGKSTLGRAILRLVEPTAGCVRFDGTELTALPVAALKPWRRRMQIVFQNPYASLNPRRTAADIVAQPLRLHGIARGRPAREQAAAMLENVGLSGAQLDRYPHQFSGGQRQRIGIARALVLNPEFLVLDEPVSALDVSVQAQVIELLARLRRELSLTCLFISHDISVIGYLSDRVAVMYLGTIVETGPTAIVLTAPQHPYTQALLSAVPKMTPPPLAGGSSREADRWGEGAKTEEAASRRTRIRLAGEPPSPSAPPSGCHFHPRCARATGICREQPPALRPISPAALVACHHAPATVL